MRRLPVPAPLRVRVCSAEEDEAINRLARSRTAPARAVARARIVPALAPGRRRRRDRRAARRLPRHGAAVDPPLRPPGGRWAGGLAARRPPPDVLVRGGRGRRRDQPDRARGCWPALRQLDPRPPHRVPERGARPRDQAQPDLEDPAGRGPVLAGAGDVVRHAARPRLRRKKGAIVALYAAPPMGAS